MQAQVSFNKLLVISVLIATVFFLFPLFASGPGGNAISYLLFDSSNGFMGAMLRTIFFALLSSLLNVAGGFILALLLSKISGRAILGVQLSFFILPITLGNVAVVFVFKVLLFNTSFFDFLVRGGITSQSVFLLFLQFWQFGFLFAYLFWLNIHNIPKRVSDYAIATGLSRFEKIRDIILPYSKNLIILLLFIGFIFSFYEDSKSQFIFRASQGTGTELINHWLNRTYQSNLLINTEFASRSIFKTGLVVFATTLALLIVLGLLILFLFGLISKAKGSPRKKIVTSEASISTLVALIGIALIITPIAIALLKSKYHLSENIDTIAFPFALSLLAAFLATTFAIGFGISSRLAFVKLLSSFNSKSLLYFLGIFLLQILPPICIVLCGFKWLSWIGYDYDLVIYIVWISGHCILTLPLLGSFIIATHFSVKKDELNYLSAYHISLRSIVYYSFLRRFGAEYILTLLFAFTFIWNDAGLNMVLSDRIPSFAASLQMLFIGRAADYSKATSFVLVAVFVALACVFIWQYITRKPKRQ